MCDSSLAFHLLSPHPQEAHTTYIQCKQIARQIEEALHARFAGPRGFDAAPAPAYSAKLRSLLYNLSNNNELVRRIKTGQLGADELAVRKNLSQCVRVRSLDKLWRGVASPHHVAPPGPLPGGHAAT